MFEVTVQESKFVSKVEDGFVVISAANVKGQHSARFDHRDLERHDSTQPQPLMISIGVLDGAWDAYHHHILIDGREKGRNYRQNQVKPNTSHLYTEKIKGIAQPES